jgi:NAD(P)-dependent dehydrogenase (short-subunit alcohol dehydrogenase family)
VIGLAGDVADSSQVGAARQAIERQLGPVTILVNNAGINTSRDRRAIHEYADDDWHRILRVDLTGVFVVSKAIVPGMIQLGRGRIVNIASVAGLVPLRLQSAYVAAKAGAVNLTKSMALELGPRGILTNCVAPGSILTRGTRALFYGDGGEKTPVAESLLAHVPLGRPGTPEEIASAVAFLVAPEASYINGAVLTVDGGWTAGYTRDW